MMVVRVIRTGSRYLASWLSLIMVAAAVAEAQVERTSRDSWQRVDDIFAALAVEEGDVIADVGAGSGYFTFRLSRRVGPQGRVIAEDINQRVLQELREAAEREGILNIETLVGETDDTGLPEQSVDGVLIVNAYHEMADHGSMLASIRRALRPEGRLVIVDMTPRDSTLSRDGQVSQHALAMAFVVQELEAAGFEVVEQVPAFVSWPRRPQWLVAAVVAGSGPR